MKLSVKTKLGMGFAVVLALSLVAGGVAYRNQQAMRAELATFADVRARQIQLVGDIRVAILDSSRAEKNAILTPDMAEIQRFHASMMENRQRGQQFLQQLRGLSDAAAQRVLDDILGQLARYTAVQDRIIANALLNSNVRARAVLRNEAVGPRREARAILAELRVQAPTQEARLAALALDDASYALTIGLRDIIMSENLAELAEAQKDLTSRMEAVRRQRDELRRILGADAAQARNLWSATDRWLDLVTRITAINGEGGNLRAAELSIGEARQALNQLLSLLDIFNTSLQASVDAARGEAMRNADEANTLLASVLLLSVLAGIGAAFGVALAINRGLRQAAELTQAVAGGDLTRTEAPRSQDEIGDLVVQINQMVSRLRDIVGDAVAAAENVSAGSQELSATAEELSQGATEQASSTEEASASMEQMAANIK
ncbi:methyl-accepting chemotaxis protein, partial [Roseomonas sp. GC11]|uniref:HAMP domain-containing methyl-accepting chemotaxis protein n=1 Tax=Roseomonas sp. GC11 TaxID=2950546 RepID=UPI00210A2A22